MRFSRLGRGFSLVELVVVMTLLVVVMAVTMPSLSRFFKGRDMTEESRRLLSLAKWAREEAISRSAVMALWMAVEEGSYGVYAYGAYAADGDEEREYQLGNDLRFDVTDEDRLDEDYTARILFYPDGTVSEESVESFRLIGPNEEEDAISFFLDSTRTRYTAATGEDAQVLEEEMKAAADDEEDI